MPGTSPRSRDTKSRSSEAEATHVQTRSMPHMHNNGSFVSNNSGTTVRDGGKDLETGTRESDEVELMVLKNGKVVNIGRRERG